MTDEAFRNDLRKLMRRKALTNAAYYGELCAFISLSIVSIILLLPHTGEPLPLWFRPLTAAAVAISISALIGCATGVYGVFGSTTGRMAVALAVDHRYHLHERMAAAEECLAKGRRDAYARAILLDTARFRHIIKGSEVFPLVHHRLGIMIPFVAVALGVLATAPVRLNAQTEVVMAEGAVIREFGRRMAVRSEEFASPESISLAEEIERLGARMQRGSVNPEDGQRALEDITRRIDSQIRGLGRGPSPGGEPSLLSRELRESLNEMLDDQLSGNEVRQLKQQLKDTGAFSQRDLSTLDKAFKPYENPESTQSEGESRSGRDFLNNLSQGGARELLEEAEGQLADSLERLKGSASGDPTGEGTDQRDPETAQTGSEQGPDTGGGDQRGTGRQSDGTSSGEELVAGKPGSTEVKDQPGEETDLDRSDSATLEEVQGTIGNRDAIKALVRNLPESEQSGIAETLIVETYGRQIEEIVAGETIPDSMKSYVRSYFLYIGMTEPEKGE